MAKKFILHAGFHKTGTTALQNSLFDKQESLATSGINYPSLDQHSAAWGLNKAMWGWGDRGGKRFSDVEWGRFVRRANAEKDTFLASSEFFCEANEANIRRIKAEITAAEKQIIFTMRPLASIFTSQYQQYLKYGLKLTYEEWLHEMLDNPGKSKYNPTFWKRNRQDEVLAKWAEVFGKENITLVIADEKNPNLLYENFADAAGLPHGLLEPSETGRNRSLTTNESELLRQINLKYPTDRSWHDYRAFIRAGAIKAITDSEFPADGEKPLTPKWAIDRIAEISKQQVESIKAAKYKVLGDLDNLLVVKMSEGVNETPTMVPIESAATALLMFDSNIVSRIKLNIILKELGMRVVRKVKRLFK